MARVSAVKKGDRAKRLMDNLYRYGVREPTARRVAKTFVEKGSGMALVELYRQGWAVEKRGEGVFALVRRKEKGVDEVEEFLEGEKMEEAS
jgi:hypothetical protein